MENFYNDVKGHLENEHVVVFVDSNDPQFIEQAAEKLFNWLSEEMLIDRINSLEAITKEENFLCVRGLREQIHISNNPGYHLMLLPKESA